MGRKPGNPATYSVYQLQKKAAEHGVKLSHTQIADAVKHGLLPEPDAENRWPPVALDVLLASAALAPRVLLLSDRAVLLYDTDTFRAVITPDTVRESMAKVFNGIEDRERKLAWVHFHACRVERDHLELRPPALFLAFHGVQDALWLPSNERAWGNPFDPMRAALFAANLARWYQLAALLEPERQAAEEEGFAFPREELLTVLAARNMFAETALLVLYAGEALLHVGKAVANIVTFLAKGWREIRRKRSAGPDAMEEPPSAAPAEIESPERERVA